MGRNGLVELQRELEEAQRALQMLDGTIANLSFDAEDPGSVNGAIKQMEDVIDGKIARWRDNPLVQQIADVMKKSYRQIIIEQARQAVGHPMPESDLSGGAGAARGHLGE